MYVADQSSNEPNSICEHNKKMVQAFVIAICIHIPIALGVATVFEASVVTALIVALAIGGLSAGLFFWGKGNQISKIGAAVGLVAFSGLFVSLSNGAPQAYYHAFVALLAIVFLAEASAMLVSFAAIAAFSVIGYFVSPESVIANPSLGRLGSIVLGLGIFAGIALVLASKFAVYSQAFITSTSKMKLMASRVAMASTEISRSGCNLSDGATEQATLANAISDSIDQLTSSVDTTKDNLLKTHELTQRSDGNAKDGYHRMSDMMKAVDEIEGNAGKISNIIKAIDEISFQTNILALNAAVEAARAGEAGAGFAVVADEVRGLAQRSAKAAKETESLIHVMVESSKNGAGICKEVATSIEQMRGDIQEVNELVSRVTVSGQEQFDGIRQVNGDVKKITEITQNNAAVAEESAASAEQLKALANDLNKLVSDIDRRGSNHSPSSDLDTFSSELPDATAHRSHNAFASGKAEENAFADFGDSGWEN